MILLTGKRESTPVVRYPGAFSRLRVQEITFSLELPSTAAMGTTPPSCKSLPLLSGLYLPQIPRAELSAHPYPTSHTNIVLRKKNSSNLTSLSSPHGLKMSRISCLTLKLTLNLLICFQLTALPFFTLYASQPNWYLLSSPPRTHLFSTCLC